MAMAAVLASAAEESVRLLPVLLLLPLLVRRLLPVDMAMARRVGEEGGDSGGRRR